MRLLSGGQLKVVDNSSEEPCLARGPGRLEHDSGMRPETPAADGESDATNE
jgi:hypothetical protein